MALAAIATVVNIGTQDLFLRIYSGMYSVAASVLVGTAAGLLVKYILDKRFIFDFRARDIAHDSRTFALYLYMGVATTAIFWGFEFGFNQVFGTDEMRYLGGVIGLGIGYFAKYHLDKRFVFCKEDA
jgi:putative flippase GtrA